jgi:hypothetical protein
MIRHITAIDNVRDNKVLDPQKIKHGVVTALKISDLSGWIDPVTHLNLNFFSHLTSIVFVSEKLEKGARMTMDGDKFMRATIDPSAYGHYGDVDVKERALKMRNNIHSLNSEKEKRKATRVQT